MISNFISDNIPPPMKILNMVILIVMHLCACLQLKSLFPLKLEHCKQHQATCHPMKCGIINDIKLFSAVYWVYTVVN